MTTTTTQTSTTQTGSPNVTVLFENSGVTAVMIIDSQQPRFEVQAPTLLAAPEVIPATRMWRAEQKQAVRRAQELVASVPMQLITLALTNANVPVLAAGEQPTKRQAQAKLTLLEDGVGVEAVGGKNAAAREALLDLVKLNTIGVFTVRFGGEFPLTLIPVSQDELGEGEPLPHAALLAEVTEAQAA